MVGSWILVIRRRTRTSLCTRFITECYFFITNTCLGVSLLFLIIFASFPSFLMHACLSNSDFVLTGGFDYKIIEDVSQNRNEVRLSAVQGYMSNFYRSLPMLSTFISTHIEQHLWLYIYNRNQEVRIIRS